MNWRYPGWRTSWGITGSQMAQQEGGGETEKGRWGEKKYGEFDFRRRLLQSEYMTSRLQDRMTSRQNV